DHDPRYHPTYSCGNCLDSRDAVNTIHEIVNVRQGYSPEQSGCNGHSKWKHENPARWYSGELWRPEHSERYSYSSEVHRTTREGSDGVNGAVPADSRHRYACNNQPHSLRVPIQQAYGQQH